MDSTKETLKHIKTVKLLCLWFANELMLRGIHHDQSKLESPEKEIFDEWTPKLSGVTYGSKEYKDMLKKMKPAIDHHQQNNKHHPEYHEGSINDMDLFDIVEMFLDWYAATLRHKDGHIYNSIHINEKRFDLDTQLSNIFHNTAFRILSEGFSIIPDDPNERE